MEWKALVEFGWTAVRGLVGGKEKVLRIEGPALLVGMISLAFHVPWVQNSLTSLLGREVTAIMHHLVNFLTSLRPGDPLGLGITIVEVFLRLMKMLA
jgi:hypothetical protein